MAEPFSRQDMGRVLNERTEISCEQSGENGPPFYHGPARSGILSALFMRWLPWNWYSIDGSGWCYDGKWDELIECSNMGSRSKSVDWNGVSPSPLDADYDAVAIGLPWDTLLILCIAFAYASWLAFRFWSRRDARRRADDDNDEGQASQDDKIADGDADAVESGESSHRRPDILEVVQTLRMWLRSGDALPWRWDRTAHLALLSAMLGAFASQLLWLPNPTTGTGGGIAAIMAGDDHDANQETTEDLSNLW